MLKKIITWRSSSSLPLPAHAAYRAAHAIDGLLNLLKDAGNSLATFVNSL